MDVIALRTAGLGDTSYLITHDGLGVLVDSQRDVDRFLDAAAEAGVELRWVVETHVHNDYVSGAWEAARRSGAELVLPAGAGAAYPHTLAFHGEDLTHGGLALRPLHTPGHTPEHVSYLVLADGAPAAVLSGGSLLVGTAGRSDLLGPHRAWQLAVAQHGSVTRLAALPGHLPVYPTHGEGSFCTSASAGRTSSTIAEERRTNPALAYDHGRAFAAGELDGLQPYPGYYERMAPINISGPPPLRRAQPPLLGAAEAAAKGVAVVDARPRAVAAGGSPPGSVAVELSDQFGVWVGWLLEFDAPLVVVTTRDQDAAEAVVQLARIGFDRVEGIVHDVAGWPGGLATWRHVDVAGAARTLDAGGQVLDVRSPGEWAAGTVDGAVRCYVPDLVQGPPAGLRAGHPVLVVCASGYRSAMAASLLARDGFEPVVLDGAGVEDLAEVARAAPA